ncbi:MAG: DUF2142 domain-containing protein [Gaiellales bacterium]
MGSSSRWARRAIWLIAIAAVLRALVWVVVLPPWQGPDEGAHYSYVERIVVEHSIPPFARNQPDRFSDAITASTNTTGYAPMVTRQPLRPLRRGLDAFPPEPRNLSVTSSGSLLTGSYPPEYYLLGSVAYSLPGLHNATGRLYAIRVVSALLGGLAAFLIFRFLLAAGVPELLSLIGTAAFVQLPMFTQSSAIINPDILLSVTIVGLAAALMRARADPTRRRLAFVLLWGVLTALAKPIGGPAALLMAIAVLGLQPYGSSWRRRAGVVAGIVAAFAFSYVAEAKVSSLQMTSAHGAVSTFRYSLSYLWQFYLPKIPGEIPGPYAVHHYLPSWWVWIETGIGRFGWLTTPMPQWAYRLGFWTLVAATLVAAYGFLRRRRDEFPVAGALLVAAIAYVLLLHISEVLLLINNGGLLLQGRYLLPIVPLVEAVLLLGLARLGRVGLATAGLLFAVTFVLSVQGLQDTMVFFA